MTAFSSSLYDVVVVHRRLRPLTHELRYRLTYALFDIDELAELSGRLKLFSYNHRNLFSLQDRDHGPRDGTPIRCHLERIVAKAGMTDDIGRICLLCLPRFAGYVFNPLSIYYAFATDGSPRLVIYEVSNTFGERKTYVLPVAASDGGAIRQNCAKRFYVSPFNDDTGRYDFRISEPGERVRVGVCLSQDDESILEAHLVGARRELSDRELVRTAWRHPGLAWKVIGGIHWEALRLYLKGLRPMPRPPAPDTPVSYLPTPLEVDRSPR